MSLDVSFTLSPLGARIRNVIFLSAETCGETTVGPRAAAPGRAGGACGAALAASTYERTEHANTACVRNGKICVMWMLLQVRASCGSRTRSPMLPQSRTGLNR